MKMYCGASLSILKGWILNPLFYINAVKYFMTLVFARDFACVHYLSIANNVDRQ
jgi:hypothetical protein